MADKKEFSLEEILEEQRQQRQDTPPEAPADEPAPEGEPDDASQEPAPAEGVSSDTADLNAFATGSIAIPGVRKETPREEKPKKK